MDYSVKERLKSDSILQIVTNMLLSRTGNMIQKKAAGSMQTSEMALLITTNNRNFS